MIAKTGIPAFIMTLGLQISLRGVAYLVCDGKPIGNLPDNMLNLGVGTVFGIPIPILFMLAAFVVIGVILSRTSFGRSVYAVGGNYQAAHHSGINAKRVITLAYMISGILAALAVSSSPPATLPPNLQPAMHLKQRLLRLVPWVAFPSVAVKAPWWGFSLVHC
jgi:ribose/xylose/arabinose/galactoside ABC-type transport system permease subunit